MLEVIVILLIGGEIWLGFKAGRDEDILMNRQTAVLKALDASTSATAASMKALQSTSEAMNTAVQTQLALNYAVSVEITFDVGQQRVNIHNNGNTDITLWGDRLDNQPPVYEKDPKIITHGGFYYVLAGTLYDELRGKLAAGSKATFPFEVYMKDAKGQKYMARCVFVADHGFIPMQVHAQTTSVVPSSWAITER
jgi:hypothetical protein